MISITISQRTDGTDVAETSLNGETVSVASRHGAAMALARRLVAAGVADGPVEASGRDGALRWTSPSLHRLAEWALGDTERGIVRRRFVPNTRFPDSRDPQEAA